jgi:cytochrome c oxidase cbb3-type subunit 3
MLSSTKKPHPRIVRSNCDSLHLFYQTESPICFWLNVKTMFFHRKLAIQAGLLALFSVPVLSQEPTFDPSRKPKLQTNEISGAALQGSKQDPGAVERGGKTFATYCAGCHGAAGKGGPGAPDLIRSVLVLDDEKGILIAPVIREGRPDKGMPKLGLTEPQIADTVAWLHARTYAAGHRGTYTFQNIVTGDAHKGEAYFAANCAGCHSATKDLAGIGAKYDALSLQSRWLQPPGRDHKKTVTVTRPSGDTIVGTLDFIDDFNVELHDQNGQFHSISRAGDAPKLSFTDPLQAHTDLLHKYSDSDIHNLTAYLVTLK